MNSDLFNIEEELRKLPDKPGVYLMHDKSDEIIYVGKAVILKNRVRSYFRDSTKKTLKISTMVSKIAWFEYIVTDSELEALVLENNLIKEYKPKYNTLLKDDKTYPFIKVTVNEEFPRIFMTRNVKKDKAVYFGPYTAAGAVKDTIDFLCKAKKIRTCNRKISVDTDITSDSACLYHHIHACSAPCIGLITREEYGKNVDDILMFLNGNYSPIIKELKDEMYKASEEMRYEDALEIKNLIDSLSEVLKKQKITDTGGEDKDIIAMARNESAVIVQIFYVRNGKIIGKEHYYMQQAQDTQNEEIIRDFLLQFYGGTSFIPKEIIIPCDLEEIELISKWLSEKREKKVVITAPKKGRKEKLIELAEKNAAIILQRDLDKEQKKHERTNIALDELRKLLSLDKLSRMEAYDISNISGFDSVGSMVVYEDGKPKKNDYRKFKINSVDGPNDYASLKEVLSRRFEHGIREINEESGKYSSFSRFPDLILMDGGRGQVNVAKEVIKELGLDIPICGMVKDDTHSTRGLYYDGVEIEIKHSSESFKLITRIQDEAHRFAIEFHRKLRSKGQVHSVLDDIEGIGEKRRNALMKYYSSLDEIRKASVMDLANVPSMDMKAAENLKAYFEKEYLVPKEKV